MDPGVVKLGGRPVCSIPGQVLLGVGDSSGHGSVLLLHQLYHQHGELFTNGPARELRATIKVAALLQRAQSVNRSIWSSAGVSSKARSVRSAVEGGGCQPDSKHTGKIEDAVA